MRMFKLPTEIHKYNDINSFIEDFNIGSEDLVLTHEFLRDNYLDRDIKVDVIVQESYGTGEPSNKMIDSIIKDVAGKGYKRIIALGGGTVIDIAKLLIFENKGTTLEMFEKKCKFIKDKELVVIPTTCGTGSEVTNISIAEIKEKNTKMGLAIDELYPDYAVLISDVVKGLPYDFFVYSSIDALIHACEAYVSPKANQYTDMFAKEAIEMIINGYVDIIENGIDYRVDIIDQFVVASNYAGIAFGNAGVGAVHALSYPLGGTYHVPHGEANYLFFIEVFKKYQSLDPLGKLSILMGRISTILEVGEEEVLEELEILLENMINIKPLKEYGMKEEEIDIFAKSVIEKQQRLLANNYVAFDVDTVKEIYRKLF